MRRNGGAKGSNSKTAYPHDLALLVHRALRKCAPRRPTLKSLVALFECLYFASLRTEESKSITLQVVYLDPDRQGPKPEATSNDSWSYVKLKDTIPVTVSNIAKIAHATDPRSSLFTIFGDSNGQWFVWGMVDQASTYHEYVNYEREHAPKLPGAFQVGVFGVGHVIAYLGWKKIAELKIDRILRHSPDILHGGEVFEQLRRGIGRHAEKVNSELPKDRQVAPPQLAAALKDDWISSICRLLLRIKSYGHGGAILITPTSSFDNLKVKYKLHYARLQRALVGQAVNGILWRHSSDIVFQEYIDEEVEEIPIDRYLDESESRRDYQECRNELEGAIWFISLLSRVDGLILMNQDLDVEAFGVEIMCRDDPPSVFLSSQKTIIKDRLTPLPSERFGMRHRSMIRYCWQVPGSVGFVVSQDGDVRAITAVGDRVILWENIKLQVHHFMKPKNQRKSSQRESGFPRSDAWLKSL
jgi:sensor domain DACNV-containing protein